MLAPHKSMLHKPTAVTSFLQPLMNLQLPTILTRIFIRARNDCANPNAFPLPKWVSTLSLTPSTASAASLSGNSTLAEVNIDAMNIFQPMGHSPVPADICLVGLDDDSVDEFDTPLHNASDASRHPINFDDAPCDAADLHNWDNDDIDDVHASVNTGAMVTCTGQQHITHGHTGVCTKIWPCLI